ncbi:hypothetical protein RP20_CCG013573 [Aedes albopictus]|nr:hypothetical protein RP20_CCG013573 [Aedes albopictus]
MKVFSAIITLTLAVASQASYISEPTYPSWPVSTSVWPSYGVYGKGLYNNNAWQHANSAAWNGHSSYVNSWSPAWSQYNGYDNGLYGHNINVLKSEYPWGQPWGTYRNAGVYGWGHHGGYLSSVPVSKQIAATPGSVHVAPVPVGGEKLIVA